MADTPVIRGRRLGYTYGTTDWSLADIDIALDAGEILALTGPNGSGKTTLMRLLATVRQPRTGSLEILGADVKRQRARIRHRLGYVAQKSGLADGLTVTDNLFLAASCHGFSPRSARRRIDELAEIFSLDQFRKRTVGELSGGQYRRVTLARVFLGDPQLLLLDEPTVGMDAASRDGFHAFLKALADGAGVAIVLASHDPIEVTRLATQRLHLNDGRVAEVACEVVETKQHERAVTIRFLRSVSSAAIDHFSRLAHEVIRHDAHTIECRLEAEMPLNSFLDTLSRAAAIVEVRSCTVPCAEQAPVEEAEQWVS